MCPPAQGITTAHETDIAVDHRGFFSKLSWTSQTPQLMVASSFDYVRILNKTVSGREMG